MNVDSRYMHRCIELAGRAAGHVAPNPMVGAVLVHEGRVIGEGWHERFGEAHAEVNCINNAKKQGNGELISKSAMYVSLEPCAHYGKTPPCADLIVKSKIPSVVIGCRDPFAEVNGKGIEKLRAAGVEVHVGLLEKESIDLNKRFFTFHKEKRPYIILKWAETANGKIGHANGERLYITNEISNRLVHRWRSEEAAILVGTNTALQDDPLLTNRHWHGPTPLRLVIDHQLRLPHNLKLMNGEVKTIIFNSKKQEEQRNLVYHKVKDRNLEELLQAMYELKIQSVMVEGGSKLTQSFIDAGYWDEARVLRNRSMVIDAGIEAPVLYKGELERRMEMGEDEVSFFRRRK